MDAEKEFKTLIAKAKENTRADSKSHELRKGLAYYQQAYKIHQSEKLERRMNKLKAYLEQLSESENESEEEDGDEMVHVGDGFYLYKDLYEKLYEHQRKGTLFFWKLFQMKKGGILGDDMGLGKTIQVCAFLSGMFDASHIKTALIVVPVAVILNWMNEFQKWAPGLDVHNFHDQSKKERERTLRRTQLRGGICITSYGIVVNNADILSSANGRPFTWDYVILDEGHKIKNPCSKSAKGVHTIPARNRIVLSGTPLMNNLKELWALFDWTHAGQLLGNAKTFSMEYEGPITRARQKDATAGEQRLGVEMSKSLQEIISPFFLRRTKVEVVRKEHSGDSNAPHMPTLTRKNDLICWVYLSEIQEKIYRDFVQTDDVRELLSSTRSPLVALTVLKKICDHPRLMTNRQCESLGLTTSADVDVDALDAMVAEDTAHFSVSHIPDKLLIEESGKMVFLIELLENLKAEGHRCLVFSQSRKVLNIIQKVVQNRGHRIVRIDGTVRQLDERQKIIDRFMKDKSYSLFLLTTQVGGVGLTLTAADRVVIFDPSWNPATDSQAVDRAFRIGQDRNVVVYRLITCGTIEEKIYRRQIFKDSINRMMTGDTSNPFRYFTKQDLRELFQLSDCQSSATQQQLEQMQTGLRKTDTELDAHIAFLYSLALFGISDHDLMFEIRALREVEGEADVDDDDSELYVKSRALRAREALKTESEANLDLVKTLGKYPGPQGDDVTKLFKTIQPSVLGSTQTAAKRNFPKPSPLFTSVDLVGDSRLSPAFQEPLVVDLVEEEPIEEQLEDLELEEESTEQKYANSPIPSRKAADENVKDYIVLDSPLSSQTEETDSHEADHVSPNRTPIKDRYEVAEETLLFSPVSSKPLVSMETKQDEPLNPYLPIDISLRIESPKMSISASSKRRSSFFRRRTVEGRMRRLTTEIFENAESPAESPVVKTKRRIAVISSDDEDDEISSDRNTSKEENTSRRISDDASDNEERKMEDEEVIDETGERQPEVISAEADDVAMSIEEEMRTSSPVYLQTSTNADRHKANVLDPNNMSLHTSSMSPLASSMSPHPNSMSQHTSSMSPHPNSMSLHPSSMSPLASSMSPHAMSPNVTVPSDKRLQDNDKVNADEIEEDRDRLDEESEDDVDEEEEEEEDSEEDDEDIDVEKFQNLITQGKAALNSNDYMTALTCFVEANKICGGNDRLEQEIEKLKNI